MKNKITQITLFFAMVANLPIYAQTGAKINAKKEDFVAMAEKPLIVELLEEDELKKVKSFTSDYNTIIKLVVGKYWTYNEKIEYRTTKQIDRLKDLRNDDFVILSFVRQSDEPVYGQSKVTSNPTVPSFNYTRVERPDRKPDYKMYIPSSEIGEGIKIFECDLKYALLQMQAHFKWMTQNNKIISFGEYAEKIAKENCPKLKNIKLQVEKSFMQEKTVLNKKFTEEAAAHAYGHNIEFVASEVPNSNYIKNTKETAVVFIVPYGARYLAPMEASANLQRILVYSCYKVIVDCETNEILWAEVPNLVQGNTLPFIKESEFKDMGECK